MTEFTANWKIGRSQHFSKEKKSCFTAEWPEHSLRAEIIQDRSHHPTKPYLLIISWHGAEIHREKTTKIASAKKIATEWEKQKYYHIPPLDGFDENFLWNHNPHQK
jgi:hypothetical protein